MGFRQRPAVSDPERPHGRGLAVAVSADGRYVIASSLDRSLLLWNLENGSKSATFYADHRLTAVSIAPDALQKDLDAWLHHYNHDRRIVAIATRGAVQWIV